MKLDDGDKKSVLLKAKDLCGGGPKAIVKSESTGQNLEVARFQ
jgi:hypothetical protein